MPILVVTIVCTIFVKDKSKPISNAMNKGINDKYNPYLSIKENAELCNSSIAGIRSFIQKKGIDRRYDEKFKMWKRINRFYESHQDYSAYRIAKELGLSQTTIKKYLGTEKPSQINPYKTSKFDRTKLTNNILSVNNNQQVILNNILSLHIDTNHFDCDLTFSKGVFYKKGIVKPPTLKFDLHPQTEDTLGLDKIDEVVKDGALSSIIIDLPFVVKQDWVSVKPLIIERFNGFDSVEELKAANNTMMVLAYRKLKRNGVLVMKTQDTSIQGKQFWTSQFVLNLADEIGFQHIDTFILVNNQLLFTKHSLQHIARKNHSYFFVFRKTTKTLSKREQESTFPVHSSGFYGFNEQDINQEENVPQKGRKRSEIKFDKDNLNESSKQILQAEAQRTEAYKKNWASAIISWDSFDLLKEHTYDTKDIECWSFSKGKGHRNGIKLVLGNMSNDYGVEILGIKFPNSEVPFQLADFKNDEASINIQKEIINSKTYLTNGYIMKHKFCNERDYVENRRDIEFDLGSDTWCYEWMKWIIWEKVKQNKGFRDILLSIPKNAMIIEKAQHKNDVQWGAWNEELMKERKIVINAVKAVTGKGKTSQVIIDAHFLINNKGIWKGINKMGQILTMAKLALYEGINLPIEVEILNKANICWFGDILRFIKDKDGSVRAEAVKA